MPLHKLKLVIVDVSHCLGRQVLASSMIDVNGNANKVGYVKLARTGDKFGDNLIGRVVDKDLKVVFQQDASGGKGGTDEVSTNPDFFSILQPSGATKMYYMVQFESPR